MLSRANSEAAALESTLVRSADRVVLGVHSSQGQTSQLTSQSVGRGSSWWLGSVFVLAFSMVKIGRMRCPPAGGGAVRARGDAPWPVLATPPGGTESLSSQGSVVTCPLGSEENITVIVWGETGGRS